jgi:hypothetical protein
MTSSETKVLKHMKPEENLLEAVWNGTYIPPEVNWTSFTDKMGRITFVGRVIIDEDETDIAHLFTVTVFDLEGLKEALDEAVVQYLGF